MRRVLGLVAIAAMIVPRVGMALTAEDCQGVFLPVDAGAAGTTSGVPVDLADGWVGQGWSVTSANGMESGTDVSHCPSGNMLRVSESLVGIDRAVVRQSTVLANEVFRAAIASPDRNSVDDIIADLAAGGALSEPVPGFIGLETCGCAVFYPDARGDKRPWADWSGQ
jgi:hypothetical protein